MYDGNDQEKLMSMIAEQAKYRAQAHNREPSGKGGAIGAGSKVTKTAQYESALMQMMLAQKYEASLSHAQNLANVQTMMESAAFKKMTRDEQNLVLEEMGRDKLYFKDF